MICEVQEKPFREDSFDCEEEDDEILPEPSVENLAVISKEIASAQVTQKMSKIQDHIISDNVFPN